MPGSQLSLVPGSDLTFWSWEGASFMPQQKRALPCWQPLRDSEVTMAAPLLILLLSFVLESAAQDARVTGVWRRLLTESHVQEDPSPGRWPCARAVSPIVEACCSASSGCPPLPTAWWMSTMCTCTVIGWLGGQNIKATRACPPSGLVHTDPR